MIRRYLAVKGVVLAAAVRFVYQSGEAILVKAIEAFKSRSVNALVNAGAIAAVSMVQARSSGERWERILGFYSKLAGRKTVGEQLPVVPASYLRRALIAIVRVQIFLDPSISEPLSIRDESVGFLGLIASRAQYLAVLPCNNDRCRIPPSHNFASVAVLSITRWTSRTPRRGRQAGEPYDYSNFAVP